MELPKRPDTSRWTEEQWAAIHRSGCNVLVAAAAGSGKTAVLVERIIKRVSNPENPVDVDRLLVATFTKAAADEMRERIREALEQAWNRNSDDLHLKRQLVLIHRAPITTLHSFCMEVVKQYAQEIELDPGFRIANPTEAELLRQDVLETLMEEQYSEAADNDPFWQLVDWFGGERGDMGLYQLIMKLYDYSRSHPWPDHWLRETAAQYRLRDIEKSSWLRSLVQDLKLELEGIADLLREAHRLALQPSGPEPYAESLTEEIRWIHEVREALDQSWDAASKQAQNGGAFVRLKACRGDEYDKTLQEKAKALRDEAKKLMNALAEDLFSRTMEDMLEECKAMEPLTDRLVQLIIRFSANYQREKKRKGLVDFSDLEHYCLQILRDASSAPGHMAASAVAQNYQERFEEILLDEYQDTNEVQESIVRLISRENPGNRFMVGDVKQSIYRFRLAEPGLFMDKYSRYAAEGERLAPAEGETDPSESGSSKNTESPLAESNVPQLAKDGIRIDLARNFRSRADILHGINFVFRQCMTEKAAEFDYDGKAELIPGLAYPDGGCDPSIELLLTDTASQPEAADGEQQLAYPGDAADSAASNKTDQVTDLPENEAEALATAQLEARLTAMRIQEALQSGTEVFDKKTGAMRPATCRDIVVLLRSTRSWAPVFIEEFQKLDIPSYGELSTGYFDATEVDVMLSLLKIIDNAYQDIPFASVLRSPVVGLSAEELSKIRIHARSAPFYEAVQRYAGQAVMTADEQPDGGHDASAKAVIADAAPDQDVDLQLSGQLQSFLSKLRAWRNQAREGSLADLIWRLYQDTGYFDFVGGLPGGKQRQANLQALYDRARQYEATSFRGLFRFLRFIERMRDSGGDLGAAKALGEQEEVVRIMSIHKSKGLEFPIVFVAGLSKSFNEQDLRQSVLVHKEMGFGAKFIDTDLRISYPTLPWHAIVRRMRRELLAEEQRILYVALTRAREKLILVATVKDTAKQMGNWMKVFPHDGLKLPDPNLVKARNYLDWLGPALIRHPHLRALRMQYTEEHEPSRHFQDEPSVWNVSSIMPGDFLTYFAEAAPTADGQSEEWEKEKVRRKQPLLSAETDWGREIARRFGWRYTHEAAVQIHSKTSVSEIKRLAERSRLLDEIEQSNDWGSQDSRSLENLRRSFQRRPVFMEEQSLSAAERGTVYHAVMQHLPIRTGLTRYDVEESLHRMVLQQLITEQQRESVDAGVIFSFIDTSVGQRMLRAKRVLREVPFSYGISADEFAANSSADDEDGPGAAIGGMVLVQGVIDCLFEDEDGVVLLDYKTDAIYGNRLTELTRSYSEQIRLYARAIQDTWNRELSEMVLFFFDGSHLVSVDPEDSKMSN